MRGMSMTAWHLLPHHGSFGDAGTLISPLCHHPEETHRVVKAVLHLAVQGVIPSPAS